MHWCQVEVSGLLGSSERPSLIMLPESDSVFSDSRCSTHACAPRQYFFHDFKSGIDLEWKETDV